MAPLSSLPMQGPQSLWVYHFVLIPLPAIQATRSLSVLLKPCSAGEGAINPALSQESCRMPGGRWPGTAVALVPALVPGTLLSWSSPLTICFFQCPLCFLVSYLHKRWGTVVCSLCFSVDWLGDSPVCRGKSTLLPPISPLSSLHPILEILKCLSHCVFFKKQKLVWPKQWPCFGKHAMTLYMVPSFDKQRSKTTFFCVSITKQNNGHEFKAN